MRDEDDDGSGSGMSGWAGYMLGYSAGQSAHRARESVAAIWARRRGEREPYSAEDVDSAIASWERAVKRRDMTIGQLQAQLQASGRGNAALRQQLVAAGGENQALREQVAKLKDEIPQLRTAYAEIIRDLDLEVAALKEEIERLKGQA